MKLPKRPEAHLTEAGSWRVLQKLAPKEWIVREVTERDYGIDSYIELTSTANKITGDLIFVQLKGEKKINWKGASGAKSARSPSIKVSTVNYWLKLPVPVFLFVADLSADDIYFVSVEPCIRNKYGGVKSQDTISFTLRPEQRLGSKDGIALLRRQYERERLHESFTHHATALISHLMSFTDFIQEHQGRDRFMEVEPEDHLQFRALHETCRLVAAYLGQDWPIESLEELYRQEKADWPSSNGELHEQTLDRVLEQVQKIFPDLVKSAVRTVTETQREYWFEQDPVFFNLCQGISLADLDQRFADIH